MVGYSSPAISDNGVQVEKEHALIDAQNVIRELGQIVTIQLHEETTVTRDKLNSIIKRNTTQTPGIAFYAYPVIFNPTDKQLEDYGIREKTQVLVKTAMQDWVDNGFSMETLQAINSIRAVVIIDGAKYEIRDKQLDSQFADTYLYIHLGLNRI